MLICPVCQNLLVKTQKQFVCVHNHSFDIAKQGYVNLLRSDQKKSLNPGDNKEMVNSRLAFLNNHHYLPISIALNNLIKTDLKEIKHANIQIADLGCGVGYYLNQLKETLSSLEKPIAFYGIDISKEAIACACRQTKDITYVVSSAKNLPLETNSLDIVMCVFAPSYFEEIARVLKPDGFVYIITPGDSHLVQIKEMLYEEVSASKGDNVLLKSKDFLTLNECVPVNYTLKLDSQQDITHLFKMTPFYWQMAPLQKEALTALNELTLTVDIKIWRFKVK